MLKDRLLVHALLLFILILLLNFGAHALYLFWTVWWFDMALHILSTALIGILVVRFFGNRFLEKSKILWITFLAALVIGLSWEVYELSIGRTSFSDGASYFVDTLSDLVLDICGGLIGAIYGLKIKK